MYDIIIIGAGPAGLSAAIYARRAAKSTLVLEGNAYGGQIPQTYGVPVEEIVRGIKSGVRKVNVDTDSRMAITGEIRKVYAEKPSEFDPRKYLKPAIEEMQKVCEERYIAFGAAGYGDKIKAIKLSDMAKRYAAGEL